MIVGLIVLGFISANKRKPSEFDLIVPLNENQLVNACQRLPLLNVGFFGCNSDSEVFICDTRVFRNFFPFNCETIGQECSCDTGKLFEFNGDACIQNFGQGDCINFDLKRLD